MGNSVSVDTATPHISLANGGAHAFAKLSDTRFEVAWPGANTNGKIQTFDITAQGIEAAVQSFKFSNNAKWISMAKNEGDTVLAYAGLDGDGYIILLKPPEVAPSGGKLSAHALSDSSIRFSYIPGASGTDVPNSFDLRCKESTQTQWRMLATKAHIPTGNIYVVSGLLNDVTLECQWRLNSDHGEGEWSNTASATTVRPEYQEPPRDDITGGPIIFLHLVPPLAALTK